MKICFVSQEYPLASAGGGIGTQTYLKAHGLTARGHEAHVVSITYGTETSPTVDRGVVVHRVAAPALPVPGYEPASAWLNYSAAVARKLTELCPQERFDVLHFPEYGAEGFVYQADTFVHRTARYVVQMHGALAMFVEQTGWPAPGSPSEQVCCYMERMVLQWTDARMASSRFTAEFCGQRYGFDAATTHVIHSAVNTDRFQPVAPVTDERFPRILFVGNLSDAKGLALLLEAVGQLRPRFPRICLRVLGKGSKSYREKIQRLIKQYDIPTAVELRGYVPYAEIPAQYTWCDLYAGPSYCEGGPGNVYLEAMASGRPVIACNTGGVPEVVLDGKTGRLIPPRQVAPLVEALGALSDNAAERARLGRQAREWILERFTMAKYIDRVETIYRDLVETK